MNTIRPGITSLSTGMERNGSHLAGIISEIMLPLSSTVFMLPGMCSVYFGIIQDIVPSERNWQTKIGRASCREKVKITVVWVICKTKIDKDCSNRLNSIMRYESCVTYI